MANPAQFTARIRRIAVGVLDGAAKAARNSALGAVRTVVRGTPVDSGWARSNWVAKVGEADLSERAIRAPSEVIDEARGALDLTVIRGLIAKNDEVEIHIANGGDKVPYLGLLNSGSSRQAPAGFVPAALQVGGRLPLSRARLLQTRGSRAVGV